MEALKVYYEYTVSRYERYRWFIYVGKHFATPPLTGDIKYHPTSSTIPLEDELAIIATSDNTNNNLPTITNLDKRDAIYNEVLIGREIYYAILERLSGLIVE